MGQKQAAHPDQATRAAIASALGRIPTGVFVLTAEHEERRAGMLVSWVQQVCVTPAMVSVAVAKGKSIMPLISESRRFGLCQLAEDDRLMHRKFAHDSEVGDDPFLGFELRPAGVPIMADAMSYLECELSCHMDVEGDHDLFVGVVRDGGAKDGKPRIKFSGTDATKPAAEGPGPARR